MAEITREAIDAVGVGEPADDWEVDPAAHALALPPRAGALRRILERPEIAEQLASYRLANPLAIRQQAKYRFWSRLAFFCRFGAICVGALGLLALAGNTRAPAYNWAVTAQYALIFVSFVGSLMIAFRKPFEKWMDARAKAENARLNIFQFAAETDEPVRDGELPLLPLQLEYFRRYQLAVQHNFYETRSRKHADGAFWIGVARWATLLLLAFAAVPAGLGIIADHAPGVLPPWLLPWADFARKHETHMQLLVLGIMTSALAELVVALSLANLDQRNAARYTSNAENLAFITKEYLRPARAAAAAGDRSKVSDFVELVQMYISSEHREWILVREIAQGLALETFAQLRLPGRRRGAS